MRLPEPFIERMRQQLGDTFPTFLEHYATEPYVGLKVNTLKVSAAELQARFPYRLTPIPWAPDGFYYAPEAAVTRHPYYYAGLYYIQEPSAMAPANALSPTPGMLCADLCAAPGGKSMHLATALEGAGVLVANDISEKRIKAVVRNIERFGIGNAVVLNEDPVRIADQLGPLFDAVLVDAPCSGEGMFRKDQRAVKSWEAYGPAECAPLQSRIADAAVAMLKPGGRMIYSTCTFAPEENEAQIERLEGMPTPDGCRMRPHPVTLSGISEGADVPRQGQASHMIHLWPHVHGGEGHFVAGLEKAVAPSKAETGTLRETPERAPYPPNVPPEPLQRFMEQHLSEPLRGHFALEGDRVFLRPAYRLPLEGLHVVREGLFLGDVKKGRFTPSQALALYLKGTAFSPRVSLKADQIETIKYLKGETLHLPIETEGLHLVCVDEFPLGFAKVQGGMLKNQYPVSWRML